MINAGIFDEDIAVFESVLKWPEGSIAAVVLDEEVTLRRVFKTQEGIRLETANPDHPDQFIPMKQANQTFRLKGVLVGTIRQFDFT